jgi:ABC-type lipoprotein release transport system permease subunit
MTAMRIPLSYTWRSLWTRKLTTLLTLGGIMLVVFVFASVLMLAHGLEVALIETGSPQNVIVLRRSAQSELLSQVSREEANIVRYQPEIALRPDGKPMASPETYVVINLTKKSTNDMANISVRGVSEEGLPLRSQVTMLQGRMFTSGTREIVVGKNIAREFVGTTVGEQLRFGDATWDIVGVIDGNGTAFDSEIWGDVEQLMPAFGRPVFSSLTARLTSEEALDALKSRVEKDPRLQSLELKRENVYYAEQSKMMSDFIKVLGLIVTLIFSVGAIIGAMITMYAAVANRTVEIGTLRALGFRRRSVMAAFLVESLLLGLLGGFAGVGLASLMSLVRISTMNFGTFSELAFGFVLSPQIVVTTILFSLLMGIVGGFLPAVRASRLNILAALRSG